LTIEELYKAKNLAEHDQLAPIPLPGRPPTALRPSVINQPVGSHRPLAPGQHRRRAIPRPGVDFSTVQQAMGQVSAAQVPNATVNHDNAVPELLLKSCDSHDDRKFARVSHMTSPQSAYLHDFELGPLAAKFWISRPRRFRARACLINGAARA
jgi:hypothetical protein